ncbi:MAG: hypothetical protein LUE93_15325 [Bacteroides sp.]|nr:hypothetical protein [Bacteroides sp.]
MRSETDFSELKERVSSVEEEVEEIKEVTVWGQKLSGNVNGDLNNVGQIRFIKDGAYPVGSDQVRPSTVRARSGVRVGNTDFAGDSRTGVNVLGTGGVTIQVSQEDTSTSVHPRLLFYVEGATTPTSAIREAYPGTLSIPNKLRVGGTATTDHPGALFIEGTSYMNSTSYHRKESHFGANKNVYNDGVTGITVDPGSASVIITTSEEETHTPKISFFGKSKTTTSRIQEGFPGLISLETTKDEGVYIGTNARTVSLDGYRLMVSGDSYLNGALNMQGKLWMNSNKIHLGTYLTGVSGISFINGRGILIESANHGSNNDNIELYTKLNGNIILNTTNGKALYKDAEVATADDISALKSEITELKQQIAALLAAR